MRSKGEIISMSHINDSSDVKYDCNAYGKRTNQAANYSSTFSLLAEQGKRVKVFFFTCTLYVSPIYVNDNFSVRVI